MEIKEINYQTTVLPKTLIPKLNYFVRDFLNDYSDYLDDMEAGTNFDTEVEYEGDLEVYFVKFIFRKAGDKFFSRVNNELSLYCNGEEHFTVIQVNREDKEEDIISTINDYYYSVTGENIRQSTLDSSYTQYDLIIDNTKE